MRDYAKVSPLFWTGKTGKLIRSRGSEGVIAAMYLMSSPHSNMLGLYYQPKLYMAHETGLGIDGASKGLLDCIESGFCHYDEATEMVWVMEMASYQIASELKASDKRCAGIQKEYDNLPDNPFLDPFFTRYAESFHLTNRRIGTTEFEDSKQAPSKPHRSQEQEQEQEQEQKQDKPTATSAAKLPTCQTQAVIDLYHDILPNLPKVRLHTKDRVKAIRKVWEWVLTSLKSDHTRRAETAEQALAWFRSYFERATENDFLMGRTARGDAHAGWKCDLDFLLTDRGMKHVIEKTQSGDAQ